MPLTRQLNYSNLKNRATSSATNLDPITYNDRYPGLDEYNYKKLKSKVDSLGLQGYDKEKAMDEAYQQVLPMVQTEIKNSDRRKYINQAEYEVSQMHNVADQKIGNARLSAVKLTQEIKEKYNIDPTMDDDYVLQTWLNTIPNGDQLFVDYLNNGSKELLYKGGLEDKEEVKQYNLQRGKINDALIKNRKQLSVDGLKYLRDYNSIFQTVDLARQQGMGEGMTDDELLKQLLFQSPELQQLKKEIGEVSQNLSFNDKTILGLNDDPYAKDRHEGINMVRDFFGFNSNSPATHDDIQEQIYVKENMDGEIMKNFKANLRNWGDSMEKTINRFPKDIENLMNEYLPTKKIMELELGKKLSDDEYNQKVKERKLENIKQVQAFDESLNKEAQASKERVGLNPTIEKYYQNQGMIESLFNNDLKGYGYKSAGDMASNWDVVLGIGASIVNPVVGLAVMGTDTFARENQEAFDSLIEAQTKQGVSYEDAYDNASKGAVVVGLVNTAIELGLEKALGGLETRASDNIKSLFMKDLNQGVTEMIAKRGIMDMLAQGLADQAKASLEEGLEEVFQQAVQNIAVSEYDPDQKISDGLWRAFESGALNPMNLLAGGTDLLPTSDTVKESMLNGAYNLGVGTRNVVDTFNPQNIISKLKSSENIGENTATETTTEVSTPSGNEVVETEETVGNTDMAIPQTSINDFNNPIANQNGEIVEGSPIELIEDEDFDGFNTEDINGEKNTSITQKNVSSWDTAMDGLDENTRERIRRNPYAIQKAKEVMNNLKDNPGFDFLDWQTEEYENMLDVILEKLDGVEKKRSKDVGGLYDKLEEANTPIDTSGIKEKIGDYKTSLEDMVDELSNTDRSRIEKILEMLDKIGDDTTAVWKIRKKIDSFKKGNGATSQGVYFLKQIRKDIDAEIAKQNPEMKEVDKEYIKVLDEIRKLQGDIVYKKTGEAKNNAVSTVKNMLNQKNRLYLNTLEKYIPGIKEQLQGIRDAKFVFDAYTTGNGSRFTGGIRRGVSKAIAGVGGAVVGSIFGGPIGFAAGGVIGDILFESKIDSALKGTVQKALEKTVGAETAESKAELERINKKIEENQRLEAEEKAKLRELGDRIMQKVATMDKTDAEQSAWESWLADLEQDEVIDMPEEVYDQWEEVTTTPKKKTTKKKTSKKGLDKKQAKKS